MGPFSTLAPFQLQANRAVVIITTMSPKCLTHLLIVANSTSIEFKCISLSSIELPLHFSARGCNVCLFAVVAAGGNQLNYMFVVSCAHRIVRRRHSFYHLLLLLQLPLRHHPPPNLLSPPGLSHQARGLFAWQFHFTRRGIIMRGVNSLEIFAAWDVALKSIGIKSSCKNDTINLYYN